MVCLAGFLNERMTRQALPAVNLVKSKQVGKPLIDVIDLNIYVASAIQSLGYPSFTGAAAHAVHNGLTMLEESHHLLHGIKVGYGIIVMLYLQEKKKAEIRSVVSLFREIGLEPSFQGLQLPFTANNVEKVAERAASDGIMQKMAFLVSKEMVIQSMEQVERDISGLHVK